MTQLLESADPPPSGLAEQELLQRLIKEGLSPSGDDGDIDRNRYRKLLEILFQACVLGPIGRSFTPSSLEQAGFTLTILSRQTKARPELLSSVPSPPESPSPLYVWILPRLIHAAVVHEETIGAEVLAEDLSSAAVNVLHVLGRDLSDEKTSFAKGPRRVILALKQMIDFSQGWSTI
jgi:hypothetical protein